MTQTTQNIQMTDTEVWKMVSYEGFDVEVSSKGRVRRLARALVYKDGRKGTLPAKSLHGYVALTGYHMTSLSEKKVCTHRLVAMAFLPPPKEEFAYQTVNHINGDKLDNRPENLEWATSRENSAHARRTGLNQQKGENCNLTKFSAQIVTALRNVQKRYGASVPELSEIFGVSHRHVKDILSGKTRLDG